MKTAEIGIIGGSGLYSIPGFTGKEDMVMFGSSYPHWQCNELKVPSAFTAEQRDKLCWRNAADLYGIDVQAGVGTH